MFENKFYVKAENPILYHIILFASFFIAIKLLPFVQDYTIKYIEQPQLQIALPFVIVYIAAIYIIPEIAFSLIKSSE